jgi:hypothetical protein
MPVRGSLSMVKSRLRQALWIIGLAAASLIVGTVWHEVVGHGLTAVAGGGRIERVEILGAEVYPQIRWLAWKGQYGFCDTAGVTSGTKENLVGLMGSMSTWLVAVAAALLLWVKHWGVMARVLLAAMSCWWIDLLTYTLPSWGLHRSVFWGQSHFSEPYQAAVALGIPGWAFQAFSVATSILLAVTTVLALIRARPRPIARVAESSSPS